MKKSLPIALSILLVLLLAVGVFAAIEPKIEGQLALPISQVSVPPVQDGAITGTEYGLSAPILHLTPGTNSLWAEDMAGNPITTDLPNYVDVYLARDGKRLFVGLQIQEAPRSGNTYSLDSFLGFSQGDSTYEMNSGVTYSYLMTQRTTTVYLPKWMEPDVTEISGVRYSENGVKSNIASLYDADLFPLPYWGDVVNQDGKNFTVFEIEMSLEDAFQVSQGEWNGTIPTKGYFSFDLGLYSGSVQTGTLHFNAKLDDDTQGAETVPHMIDMFSEPDESVLSADLASLEIEGVPLRPAFSGNLTEYTVVLTQNTKSVKVNATPAVSGAQVDIVGADDLTPDGNGTITITCTNPNGFAKTYTIKVEWGELDRVYYYVDADYAITEGSFSSVKAALDAAYAKSGEWGENDSLVITVDPEFLSSENVNADKNGNSYGDLLFGVHTIFRADKSRLPITIQTKGGDRTTFTLQTFNGGSMACANSYTFKDLTFPLNDAPNGAGSIIFYAGSGQVRFENVRLSKQGLTRTRFGGDNFTKEAFVGWTQDHIDANAKNGIITTSVTLGENVSHYYDGYTGSGSAAWFGGSTWQGDANILVTPQMTKTELVVDGATVGVLTSRAYGGNAVAESVLRIESGVLNCGVVGVGSLGYGEWTSFSGDMSIVINGGTFGDKSPFTDSPSVRIFGYDAYYSINGNVNLTINGGEFAKAISVSVGGNSSKIIKKNLNITITGGDFNATGNTVDCGNGGMLKVEGDANLNIAGGDFAGSLFCSNFYGSSAVSNSYVVGNWTTNISGGTFAKDLTVAPCIDIRGNITATVSGGTFNDFFKGAPKTKSPISVFTLNIKPHESGDAAKDPVFNSACYPGWFVAANQFNWNISGGTFKSTTIACHTNSGGVAAMTNIHTTISGNPTFSSNYVSFGTARSGTNKVTVDVEGSPTIPFIGTVYGAASVGEVEVNIKGNPTFTTAYSGIGHGTFAGGNGGKVTGNVTTNISGSPIFKNSFDGVGSGRTVEGNVITNITGNPTFESYFSGAGVGTVGGSVTTTIKGGNFTGPTVVTGPINGGTVTGSVTANIEGGTFAASNVAFNAIYGSGSIGGNYTLNVSGGTFNRQLYDKDNVYGSIGGNVETNITGGTFNNYFVGVPNVTMDDANATKTLTIKPENDIFFKYAVFSRMGETINLVGGDGAILLGADGRIQPTTVTGNVTLKQTASWKVGQNYASFPAGHSATINVVTAADATGEFAVTTGEQGEILTVVGKKPAAILSASMVITNRIALQMYFNKEKVDALGDEFSYDFSMGEVVLKAGGKADFEEDTVTIEGAEYYVLNLPALGISQFGEDIVATLPGLSDEPVRFSISSLAQAAVDTWKGDEWVNVAKAIVNLEKAVAGENLPFNMTPERVEYDRKAASKDEDALVNITKKSLLMSNTVGLRVIGSVSGEADLEGLRVLVNGKNVTSRALITLSGNEVTIDLFFSVYGITDEFQLQILDKNGAVCLDMYERLDAFAQDMADANPENAKVSALLVYLQMAGQLKKD